MRQVTNRKLNSDSPKKIKRETKKERKHFTYGTSKLEEYFAKNFLDKLDIEYQYQFEAKDIGRFYDFFIPNSDGSRGGLLLEIDGNFWHGDPSMYKESELRGHQKRARRIDEYKNKWALLHGYPILRFWESDIKKNPEEVMRRLKERLYIQEEKIRKKGRNLGQKS